LGVSLLASINAPQSDGGDRAIGRGKLLHPDARMNEIERRALRRRETQFGDADSRVPCRRSPFDRSAAWPFCATTLKAKGNEIASETLEICHEGLEIE
jgi:hypothetical protein